MLHIARHVGAIATIAPVGLAFSLASSPALGGVHTIVDIDASIPGSTASRATAINDLGVVAGIADTSPFGFCCSTPFVWTDGAVEFVEEATSTPGRIPWGISADGIVGGTQEAGALGWIRIDGQFPCLTDPAWCNSLTFFLYGYSQVLGVSETGLFTGGLSVTQPQFSSTITAYVGKAEDGGVSLTPLGTFDGQSTVGRGVNDLGDVVGWTLPFTNAKAILFSGTTVTALPSLGATYNRADAISNTGLAVGFVATPGVQAPHLNGQGAVWDVSDPTAPSLEAIGQLDGPGGTSQRTELFAVNDAGVAVGTALFPADGPDQFRAILWSAETGLIDLNTLLPEESGWTLEEAYGINAHGAIVGSGRLEGTTGKRAFLLLPPPTAGDDDRGGISSEPRERRERRRIAPATHSTRR